MANKESANAKPAMPGEFVECCVVGVNYGKDLKGDIVRAIHGLIM